MRLPLSFIKDFKNGVNGPGYQPCIRSSCFLYDSRQAKSWIAREKEDPKDVASFEQN